MSSPVSWAVEYGDNFERNNIGVHSRTGCPVADVASGTVRHRVVRNLSQIFLPDGFPNSVQPEYLEYQFWDTLQVFNRISML